VHRITGLAATTCGARGGVQVRAGWRDALRLNLHSRLAQRVLVQVSHGPTASEDDLYEAPPPWPGKIWFTPRRASRSNSPRSTARSRA
jgi:putative N6-adenine-specific DNA methylase